MQQRHHTHNPAFQAALTRYRTRQQEKAAEPKPRQLERVTRYAGLVPGQEDTGSAGEEPHRAGRVSACDDGGTDAFVSGHV